MIDLNREIKIRRDFFDNVLNKMTVDDTIRGDVEFSEEIKPSINTKQYLENFPLRDNILQTNISKKQLETRLLMSLESRRGRD